MASYNPTTFKATVEKALGDVRTILDNTRRPKFAADVQHKYDDKFLLAETLTSVGIASILNALAPLGLHDKHLDRMRSWASSRSVTLRLKAEETCTFLREVTREEESKTTHVTTWNDSFTRKSKSVTKITEWFWNYHIRYELFAFKGNEPEKSVLFQSHSATVELMTTTEHTPYPKDKVRPSLDVNITWLLQLLDDDHKINFNIDRNNSACHTPRRNPGVRVGLHFVVQ
eukprot:TRINITY_DN876_c0_g1_i1.p1 TRINITY_DN876_c0_g1~~TRINITY_DN876_c0_g1_i1.p1  ORF type:complete len:229 (-),score=50.43 TRINITY_DN876_c0_g1_i1:128-814(-)